MTPDPTGYNIVAELGYQVTKHLDYVPDPHQFGRDETLAIWRQHHPDHVRTFGRTLKAVPAWREAVA